MGVLSHKHLKTKDYHRYGKKFLAPHYICLTELNLNTAKHCWHFSDTRGASKSITTTDIFFLPLLHFNTSRKRGLQTLQVG